MRTDEAVSRAKDTFPEITSVNPAMLPLYGTWVILTPASLLNFSIAKWETVPFPDEALVNTSGFAFAYSINSFKFLNGKEGLHTKTKGKSPIKPTVSKSFRESYGTLGYRCGFVAIADMWTIIITLPLGGDFANCPKAILPPCPGRLSTI